VPWYAIIRSDEEENVVAVARMQHRIITTVDELLDPIDAARVQPKVLRPGAMRAELVRFDASGLLVEIADYSFPYMTEGETPEGRIGLLAPLGHFSAHLNGEPVSSGQLYVYGEAAEVRAATADPMRAGLVSVPTPDLECAAATLGVDIDLPDRGGFRPVPTIEQGRLHQLFDRALQSARAFPGGALDRNEADAISDTLMEIIVRSFERRAATPVRARGTLNSMSITRVCEEFAATTRYRDVTLTKLCAAAGFGERRVREAFYDCYGMSPTAALRIAALHRVRRALLDGPATRDTVSRAASDFGFWHLSRFAGEYRALFGESPSATLGRRQPAVAV